MTSLNEASVICARLDKLIAVLKTDMDKRIQRFERDAKRLYENRDRPDSDKTLEDMEDISYEHYTTFEEEVPPNVCKKT